MILNIHAECAGSLCDFSADATHHHSEKSSIRVMACLS